MLEVGNGGLTHEEEKTHFTLWAMAKSPLLIGCDLTTVSHESLSIITNSDIIAINQDPNSKEAECMVGCDSYSSFLRRPTVYTTTLSNGDVVAAITNWRETPYTEFSFQLSDIGVLPLAADSETVTVKDLWTKDVQTLDNADPITQVSQKHIPGHATITL